MAAPSKAAVVRAAARVYGIEEAEKVSAYLKGSLGSAVVDRLSEGYADAAISGGESPAPKGDQMAEAVAMHVVETGMHEPVVEADCGHCERPEDRCSDESDRCCYVAAS